MYCIKCGEKNDNGARFCAKCGALLGGTSETERSQQQMRNKVGTKGIIVLAAAVIAVVLVVGVLISNHRLQQSESEGKDKETILQGETKETGESNFQQIDKESKAPEDEQSANTLFVNCKGFDMVELEEPVVIYDEDVKITFRGIDYYDYGSAEVIIVVENQSKEDVYVAVNTVEVNGFVQDASSYMDIKAGEKVTEHVDLFGADLELNDIEEIVELGLRCEKKVAGRNVFFDTVRLVNSESSYVQKYDDTGEEIYNQNGIRIVNKGMVVDDDESIHWDDKVHLFVENSSGYNIVLIMNGNPIINGKEVNDNFAVSMYQSVPAGKKANLTCNVDRYVLSWSDSDVLSSLQVAFAIVDEANYNTLYSTEPVELIKGTQTDEMNQVMERAITALYNQDKEGYYSLLPAAYQTYVNNPTVVFESTCQSTGVQGSSITKGEKLVLEFVREESEDVEWVNQITQQSMGFAVTEQKKVTYRVSAENDPELSQNIVLTLVKVDGHWYVWFWF